MIRNKQGNAAIWACVILLIVILLFTVISEYIRLKIIANGVKEELQSATIAVVTTNWDNSYASLREGYSAGYTFNKEGWDTDIDYGSIYNDLSQSLGLIKVSEWTKYTDGKVEFTLSELKLNIDNPKLQSGTKDKFIVHSTIILRIPMGFGWGHLPDIIMPIEVKAKFVPKF